MIAGKMQLYGATELEGLFKSLPERIQKRFMKAALLRGGELLKEAIKAKSPVLTGALRQSIESKVGKGGVLVGTEAGDFRGDTFYAAFLEYGYMKQETYRTPDGRLFSRKRGQGKATPMPARPFMRPAFQSAKDAVRRVVEDEIKHRVEGYAIAFARRQAGILARDTRNNLSAAKSLAKLSP